jgi:hypothetical protein
MVISSRTPEGDPNRCPICGNDLRIEPSKPTLDAPCPHCGHLLWFARKPSVSERPMELDGVLALLTAKFGTLSPAKRAALQSLAESTPPLALLTKAARCASLNELVPEG